MTTTYPPSGEPTSDLNVFVITATPGDPILTANTPQVTATVEQGPRQSTSYAIYKHPIAQTGPPHNQGLGELGKIGLAIGAGFALAMLMSLVIWRRHLQSKLKVSSCGQEGGSGDSSGKTGTHGPQPGVRNGASSNDDTYEPSGSHDTSNTEPMSSSISSTEVSDIGLWGRILGSSDYGLPWNVARGGNKPVRPLDEEELLDFLANAFQVSFGKISPDTFVKRAVKLVIGRRLGSIEGLDEVRCGPGMTFRVYGRWSTEIDPTFLR